VPEIGDFTTRMVEIALGLVIGRLRLQIGRELFERQIGIAEQLVQRGAELLLPKLGAAAPRVRRAPLALSRSSCVPALLAASAALAVDIAAPEIDRLLCQAR
jgi:hypothetical protein